MDATSGSTLQQAQDLFQRGRIAEAEALCHGVLAKDSQNIQAAQMVAVMAARTGRNELAIRRFREVLSLNPNAAWKNCWTWNLKRAQNRR
jgi:Tfp pilus assembly protein PilF